MQAASGLPAADRRVIEKFARRAAKKTTGFTQMTNTLGACFIVIGVLLGIAGIAGLFTDGIAALPVLPIAGAIAGVGGLFIWWGYY